MIRCAVLILATGCPRKPEPATEHRQPGFEVPLPPGLVVVDEASLLKSEDPAVRELALRLGAGTPHPAGDKSYAVASSPATVVTFSRIVPPSEKRPGFCLRWREALQRTAEQRRFDVVEKTLGARQWSRSLASTKPSIEYSHCADEVLHLVGVNGPAPGDRFVDALERSLSNAKLR